MNAPSFPRRRHSRALPACGIALLSLLSLGACGGDDTAVTPADASVDGTVTDSASADGTVDAFVRDASIDVAPPPPTAFCGLPGSVVSVAGTQITIPGATSPVDMSWATVPDGFCVHYYATVASARQIKVAPGGELFVASPSRSTAGGAPTGVGAILVIPDDNHDGFGDPGVVFKSGLSATQGLMFAPGFFYYQDDTRIMRVPYTTGSRISSDPGTEMVNITIYQSPFHWPKTLDMADDGTIYVTNGSDQDEMCVMPHVFKGGIVAIDGTTSGKLIAQGFRNPQYMRCQRGHNNCFVNELTRDFSQTEGGREKLVLFGLGQDWGFPCCASTNLPFPDIMPTPDCSGVQQDSDAFRVGSTPFGLDFEAGLWPEPYAHNVYIALHGAAGTWIGTRVVTIRTDVTTGKPLPASSADGGVSGALSDFITGFDDGSRDHGRATDVTFAADGRMFVASDADGTIFWVAPVGLQHP